jgi:hypothetical protein
MGAHVSLAFPTIHPLSVFEPSGAYEACISDLSSASGKLCALDQSLNRTAIDIAYFSSPEECPLTVSRWNSPNSSRDFSLLVVSADLTEFVEKFQSELAVTERPKTSRNVAHLTRSYSVQNLEMEVSNLFLLANILRPGSLTVAPGFSFFNDEYVGPTSPFYSEDWSRAIDASKKYKWPDYQSLSINQAWSWLEATKCIENGIARGQVGRALAALSHIAPPQLEHGSTMNLAWILLALESLYCSGSRGLKEQLVAKSELLLGQRSQNKKDFGAMYDFRSRLLHGDMDMPMRYSELNAVPDFERHFDDLGNYEGLGLAALLATLQIMVKNNWFNLSFPYYVVGEPNAQSKVEIR